MCAILSFNFWRQNRKQIKGSGHWFLSFLSISIVQILIAFRGAIPDLFSIIVANILTIYGALVFYIGLVRFLDKKNSQILNYIYLVIFTLIHSYFTYVDPNLAIRTINVAFGIFFISFQAGWFMLLGVDKKIRKITLSVGIVYITYCLINLVRIVENIINKNPNEDFFKSNILDASIYLFYSLMLVWLAYETISMVNKYLLVVTESEKEKFAKVFNSSLSAIAITRLSDGEIIDANEQFVLIAGYKREEIIGKNAVDLKLWINPEDRKKVLELLNRQNTIDRMNFGFRRKNGEEIIGQFSAEIININNTDYILSIINDITKQNRIEIELQKKYKEAEDLNKYMVDREIKMVELKKENEQLKAKLANK